MFHTEFSKKYKRHVYVMPISSKEQSYSISLFEVGDLRTGRFMVTKDSRFSYLRRYAQHFVGYKQADVIDDLLLLQVGCRIAERMMSI